MLLDGPEGRGAGHDRQGGGPHLQIQTFTQSNGRIQSQFQTPWISSSPSHRLHVPSLYPRVCMRLRLAHLREVVAEGPGGRYVLSVVAVVVAVAHGRRRAHGRQLRHRPTADHTQNIVNQRRSERGRYTEKGEAGHVIGRGTEAQSQAHGQRRTHTLSTCMYLCQRNTVNDRRHTTPGI